MAGFIAKMYVIAVIIAAKKMEFIKKKKQQQMLWSNSESSEATDSLEILLQYLIWCERVRNVR